jgi:hypothetical protein
MNDSQVEPFNVRAPRFWLAHTQAACSRCRAPLRLFALAVPPGHETLEVDEEAAGQAGKRAGKPDDQADHDPSTPSAVETWQIAGHPAFLFHIESVPEDIRTLLQELAPSYRMHPGEPGEGEQWANHCDRCGAPQDDQALFCEPEGAFFLTDETSAGRIELRSFEAAFAAAAGGYAPEPLCFDAMSRE